MMENLVIRSLKTMKELRQMQVVEKAVWHMSPTPVHQTYTALNNGGIILGAFDGDKLIGFLYSFAGFDGRNTYLCSHMLGILPEYRTGGLGVKMKWKQAELARKMGYEMITWTFDPLESVNAYLNLHKLGARGAIYKENHYGSMDDELNQGLATDRIQIKWDIGKRETHHGIPFNEAKVLLDITAEGYPVVTDMFHSIIGEANDTWFIAIPAKFQAIKQNDFQLAEKWRSETRKVFQTLFSKGYQARDVIRDHTNQLSYYAFTK
ncbi:GNAT family N-acetyltransferase [Virgibacillus necropolis]|uniref:GNAT family N-acetyltransferase n=1 Tax=Virgibacillus necropolis TaxID=163877 RepID=A0A221MCI3_9BACI|nr:GNAT family N-acetyltransferase [Virgibacillus necropolis]ASN05365.1 GNAT family N-acetyltransferase [Virgibacillus necropolis]